MYVSKSEGANFWLEVLTDLQNRGVRDILIVVLMVSKASQMPSKAYFLRVLCSSVLSIRYAILSSMLAVSIKGVYQGFKNSIWCSKQRLRCC